MKNKINKSLIIVILGMVLIIVGIIAVVSIPSSSTDDKKQKEVKEEPKELRKILEEEISDDTAKEIIQFSLNKDTSTKNKKIISASILASNEKGKYLVKLEIENNNNDTMNTSIQYLGDGKWEVELPLEYSGPIPEEYTEFWAVDGE